jgi:hypothetical protein
MAVDAAVFGPEVWPRLASARAVAAIALLALARGCGGEPSGARAA